jgi:hypothetical protein
MELCIIIPAEWLREKEWLEFNIPQQYSFIHFFFIKPKVIFDKEIFYKVLIQCHEDKLKFYVWKTGQ